MILEITVISIYQIGKVRVTQQKMAESGPTYRSTESENCTWPRRVVFNFLRVAKSVPQSPVFQEFYIGRWVYVFIKHTLFFYFYICFWKKLILFHISSQMKRGINVSWNPAQARNLAVSLLCITSFPVLSRARDSNKKLQWGLETGEQEHMQVH